MSLLRTFRCNAITTWLLSGSLVVSACAQVRAPDARTVDIPPPRYADERKNAVNERPDSVMYLPLGEDVLVPEAQAGNYLPMDVVGPFELRGETVAGALQLITADYDVSLAFETEAALTRRITVANMRGPLHTVVNRVCGLADLYCSYEDGILVVKNTQTFTVTLPPIGGNDEESEFLDDVIEGLTGILGANADDPIADPTTRTIIYNATQRTSDMAERYFQRLRASTAMIVFETYIWQVQLNSGNSTGIDWDRFETFGKFNTSIDINGSVNSDFTNPVSIGLPTTQDIGATPAKLVQFLAQFGAVKSISQPQISVLSGSEAELRVADTENYVSEISTTIDEGQATTSVSTDSVDSGFELNIGSSWDKSTVYANIELTLTDVIDIEDFTFSDSGDDSGTDTTIQLPQTSERELVTNIRVRPGDSFLIAGLVTESDNFSSRGPGVMKPLIPDSRTATTDNLELVILMRPRVIVYTPEDDYRYQDFVNSKRSQNIAPLLKAEPALAPVEPIDPVVEPVVSMDDDTMLSPVPAEPVEMDLTSIAPAPITPPVVAPVAQVPSQSAPYVSPSISRTSSAEKVYTNTYSQEPISQEPIAPAKSSPAESTVVIEPVMQSYSDDVMSDNVSSYTPSEPMVSSSDKLYADEPIAPYVEAPRESVVIAPSQNDLAPAIEMDYMAEPEVDAMNAPASSARLGRGYVSRAVDLNGSADEMPVVQPQPIIEPEQMSSSSIDFENSEPIDLQRYQQPVSPYEPEQPSVYERQGEIDAAILIAPEFSDAQAPYNSGPTFKQTDIQVQPMGVSDSDASYYPTQDAYPVTDYPEAPSLPASDLERSSPYDAYDYYVPSTR